jgi:hypothetical protein
MGIGGMVSKSDVGIILVQRNYSMATSHQQGDTCCTFEWNSEEQVSEYRIVHHRWGLLLLQFEVQKLWRATVLWFIRFLVSLMTAPQQNSSVESVGDCEWRTSKLWDCVLDLYFVMLSKHLVVGNDYAESQTVDRDVRLFTVGYIISERLCYGRTGQHEQR